MLSGMETNQEEVRRALLVAERAAAAPYIDYPASPAWFAPVSGLWFAALVGVFTWWRESVAVFVVALALLIALEAGFFAWMRQRHGALPMPGTGTPPVEIGRIWRGYFAGCGVVITAVALVWWQFGVLPAAATTFVLVASGLTWYERAYISSAGAVRERLA